MVCVLLQETPEWYHTFNGILVKNHGGTRKENRYGAQRMLGISVGYPPFLLLPEK